MFSYNSCRFFLHRQFHSSILLATGKVTYWHSLRRFGFIAEDQTNENLLVEARHLIFENPTEKFRNLKIGQKVSFSIRSSGIFSEEEIEQEAVKNLKKFTRLKYFGSSQSTTTRTNGQKDGEENEDKAISDSITTASAENKSHQAAQMERELKQRKEIMLGRSDDAADKKKKKSSIPPKYRSMKRCVNVRHENGKSGLPSCYVERIFEKKQSTPQEQQSSSDDKNENNTTTMREEVNSASEENSTEKMQKESSSVLREQKRHSQRTTKRNPPFESCVSAGLVGKKNLSGFIRARTTLTGGFIRLADDDHFLHFEDVYFENKDVVILPPSVNEEKNKTTVEEQEQQEKSSAKNNTNEQQQQLVSFGDHQKLMQTFNSDPSSFMYSEVTFDLIADPKMVNKARAVNVCVKTRHGGPHALPPRIPKPHKERNGVVVGFLGHFGFIQPKVPNHCGRSCFFHVNDVVGVNDGADSEKVGKQKEIISVGAKVTFDIKFDPNGKIRCVNVRKVV